MTRKKKRAPQPVQPKMPETAALERFRPLLSGDEFAVLQEELSRPLPLALRINPLKADPPAAMAEWAQRYGWQVKEVPFCPNGYQVVSADFPPSQTIEHRMGCYYIQDAASMLPPELFDFSGLENPLILDMAASPGGKTTHLIARNNDHGLVLANDANTSRLTALRIVLSNWGAVNTATTNFPGEKLGSWFPETFDAILLDAPCSMQSLRSSESHRMRPIAAREQQTLVVRQARLLASALQALKVGGQVVYSTCTLSPEEDEGVLDTLLAMYPDSMRIEDVSARMGLYAPGIATDGERVFHPQVAHALRLWPHRYGTSGFFAALITKTAPVAPGDFGTPPARPFEMTGLERLTARQQETLTGLFSQRYDFDLTALLEGQQLGIWQRSSGYHLIPELFARRFSSLPFGALGLPLGEDTPDGFVPAHEFVARFGQAFSAGKLLLPDEQLARWLTGQDWLASPPNDYAKGSIFVVTDRLGRNLGRGKVLHDRIKNLLPRRLVT